MFWRWEPWATPQKRAVNSVVAVMAVVSRMRFFRPTVKESSPRPSVIKGSRPLIRRVPWKFAAALMVGGCFHVSDSGGLACMGNVDYVVCITH